MDRKEFEALRDLPGKTIHEDIIFAASKNTAPVLTFDGIVVENSLGVDLVLNGHYSPLYNSISYNFVDRSVGAVCRIDVNGQIHKDAGRTHKHSLQVERDAGPRNLPYAIAVPHFEGKSPREVWEMVCAAAQITHLGRFVDPPRPQ